MRYDGPPGLMLDLVGPSPDGVDVEWIHPYTYANNNPLRFTDPSGMKIRVDKCDKDQKKKIEDAFKKVCAQYPKCLKNSGLEDCFDTLCADTTRWLFVCSDCSSPEDQDEVAKVCAETVTGTSNGPCKARRKPDKTTQKEYFVYICIPIDETKCGPLETTIMHEMIHNCGIGHGDDPNEGALDGCPKKCFNSGQGDAQKCKCC